MKYVTSGESGRLKHVKVGSNDVMISNSDVIMRAASAGRARTTCTSSRSTGLPPARPGYAPDPGPARTAFQALRPGYAGMGCQPCSSGAYSAGCASATRLACESGKHGNSMYPQLRDTRRFRHDSREANQDFKLECKHTI